MSSLLDEIPEDAVLVGQLTVVSYLNCEGETEFGYQFSGAVSPLEVVGFLEMLKLKVLESGTLELRDEA